MGKGSAMNQFCFSIGSILPAFLMIFSPELQVGIKPQYWRLVYFVPTLVNLGCILCFTFVYDFETPKYLLLLKKPKSEIFKVLEKLFGNKTVAERRYNYLKDDLE